MQLQDTLSLQELTSFVFLFFSFWLLNQLTQNTAPFKIPAGTSKKLKLGLLTPGLIFTDS